MIWMYNLAGGRSTLWRSLTTILEKARQNARHFDVLKKETMPAWAIRPWNPPNQPCRKGALFRGYSGTMEPMQDDDSQNNSCARWQEVQAQSLQGRGQEVGARRGVPHSVGGLVRHQADPTLILEP